MYTMKKGLSAYFKKSNELLESTGYVMWTIHVCYCKLKVFSGVNKIVYVMRTLNVILAVVELTLWYY